MERDYGEWIMDNDEGDIIVIITLKYCNDN